MFPKAHRIALYSLVIALVGISLFGYVVMARNPSELVIGFQYDVDTLDPRRLGPIETDIARKVYSQLVRLEPGTSNEFTLDLATIW